MSRGAKIAKDDNKFWLKLISWNQYILLGDEKGKTTVSSYSSIKTVYRHYFRKLSQVPFT